MKIAASQVKVTKAPSLVKTWSEARNKSRVRRDEDPGGRRASAAWATHEQALEDVIFRPLLARVQSTVDPIERAQLYQFFQLEWLCLHKVEAQMRASLEPQPSGDRNKNDKAWDEVNQLSELVLKVRKQIKPCNAKPKTQLFARPPALVKLSG